MLHPRGLYLRPQGLVNRTNTAGKVSSDLRRSFRAQTDFILHEVAVAIYEGFAIIDVIFASIAQAFWSRRTYDSIAIYEALVEN